MPDTYTLIQKVTVTASTSSVTFSNIPQSYTDLVIYQSAMSDVTTALAGNYNIEFNGVTTGYSGRRLYSDPSGGTATDTGTSKWGGFIPGSGALQNTPNSCIIYIPNYTSSNNKSWYIDTVVENNATNGYLGMGANVWANSAAITSFTLSGISSSIYTGNFLRNSTFYLYGVAKLGVTPTSAPKATGGDIIATDGTYWYHAFTSSSTFTPKTSLSCDVLVVAGGGSGGWPYSGGGGAGGVIAFGSQSLSTAQTVTVGGGAAGSYNTGNGQKGSNSVFGSLTAAIGGGGGVGDSTITTARDGGSGGGGRAYDRGVTGTNQGGTGTSGQGNNGGTGAPNGLTYSGGGGGGGAGAVGGNATTTVAGSGGAGTNSVTNWGSLSSVLTTTGLGVSGFIAGGGGGGTNGNAANAGAGGSGGGGRGASNDGTRESEAGTANTGSGSGGGAAGGAPASPKNAGSGLVIVRYPV